jgi:hypothetical protein
MTRYLFVAIALGAISAATPLRAANRPHAGTETQNTLVWTNDDLERLHDRDLICIVGRANEGTSESQSSPQPYVKTRDRGWYAEQAAKLRTELERRKAQLNVYGQAIQDVESLKTMKAGINLDEGDIGITPEAGIEIVQRRVNEAQAELERLQDLARRNDIPPGTLRGRRG